MRKSLSRLALQPILLTDRISKDKLYSSTSRKWGRYNSRSGEMAHSIGNICLRVPMSTPSGEIIARPMVARACGCLQEFQHFAVDKYRAQRLAKFQKTRCSACVTKLNEEQKKAAAALPKKGEALQLLPI